MIQTKTRRSKRTLQRVAILVASCLLLCGGLMLVSSLSTVEAGPIQGNGSWTDTFTDTLGISLMNNTVVDTVQERVVLSPTQIFAQTDWSGGPGLLSTTTSTDRYDSGMGVDTTTAGQVSLGYTLAADGGRADLNQDGYLDLVFSNYASGTVSTTWQYDIDSYIYWGGPDGYTTTNRLGLPTLGASSNAVADLDEDGYLDIVFGNVGRGSGSAPYPDVDSYIYWGSNQGYSEAYSTTLPAGGVTGSSVADLNGDGSLDIVFSRYIVLVAGYPYYSFETDSYIYWGDNGTYTTTNRTGLPTRGAVGNYVVDLDQDGYLDIIFSNYRQDGLEPDYRSDIYEINSYIYWGSSQGYTTTNEGRLELPTVGAHGSSVADLNKDGYLDVVFSNRNTGDGSGYLYGIDSYIYWGDGTRSYTVTNRTELPTMGTYGNSIADLDGDTWPDIIFSNHQSSPSDHIEDSYVYWGSSTGYTTTNRTDLPTVGAAGNTVGDLDNDDHLDIVFSNRRDGDNYNQNSYIYWGDSTQTGYSIASRTELPTLGTIGNSAVGSPIASANTTFGTIYAQPITGSTTVADAMTTPRIYAPTGVITSAGFDGGVVHDWKKVVWNAAIETGTNITIEVATGDDGQNWSAWTPVATGSVDGTNEADLTIPDSRYLRYRAILQASSDHLSTPTLDDIAFYGDYEPSGNATSVQIVPTSLGAWKVITWTADISAGQAITIQVLDGSGGTPIPDGDLPGNSTGFSSSPVDISSLDVSTYPSLKLKASLATDDVTTTPALEDWSVSWFSSPVSITLAPDPESLSAGEAVTYTVTARDAYGQEWEVTSSAAFTITVGAGGSWSDNEYTSEVAGTWMVTATYDSLVATATLTVNAGPLDHIVICTDENGQNPAGDHTMTTDDTWTLYAAGYDAHGNFRGNQDVTWGSTPTLDPVSGSGTSYTFDPSTMNTAGTITADGSGHTDATGTITVNPVAEIFFPIISKNF